MKYCRNFNPATGRSVGRPQFFTKGVCVGEDQWVLPSKYLTNGQHNSCWRHNNCVQEPRQYNVEGHRYTRVIN
jgi:hypothetical protein